MKVLIVDKLSPETVTALEQLELQVEVGQKLTAENLPGALADVNILVVRSTKVTAAAIAAAPQVVAGHSRRGGRRHHRPGRRQRARNLRGQLPRQEHRRRGRTGHRPVDRRRPPDRRCDRRHACGAWKKKEFGKARGLAGRTLGILGFGAIGRAVAQRALGLEMKVVAWAP